MAQEKALGSLIYIYIILVEDTLLGTIVSILRKVMFSCLILMLLTNASLTLAFINLYLLLLPHSLMNSSIVFIHPSQKAGKWEKLKTSCIPFSLLHGNLIDDY